MKEYKIGDATLHLRESASWQQVITTVKLLDKLKIDNMSVIDIIAKLGDDISEIMAIVFLYETDDILVNWNDVDFDLIVDIITSFLSSSAWLKKPLLILQKTFQSMLETILMQESSGRNITDGNAFSTEPAVDSGASVEN